MICVTCINLKIFHNSKNKCCNGMLHSAQFGSRFNVEHFQIWPVWPVGSNLTSQWMLEGNEQELRRHTFMSFLPHHSFMFLRHHSFMSFLHHHPFTPPHQIQSSSSSSPQKAQEEISTRSFDSDGFVPIKNDKGFCPRTMLLVRRNSFLCNGLVKKSANIFSVEQYSIATFFLSTKSFT